MRRFRTLVILISVLALVVPLTGMAAAETPSGATEESAELAFDVRVPGPVEGPDKADLEGGTGGRAFQPGCYGQTDKPHYSTHQPGTVNVVARTVCSGFSVYVSTVLYRHRWYGWQYLNSGSKSGTSSVEHNVAWNCAGTGTYTYLGSSYHSAGTGGYAYTNNSNRFWC